ncbi:lck-interacting transmembrane adapter 1 isoform X2 [Tupaia chinensis]|uniref:lck-interacting transmembrane adapter 1 isoform X2 n=1 Tax=Tupaia chinensis TaxID=246437 RepID=UPI0003C912FD|nr:lck-interacting transmembrane adapter 1 isoform X2 [Tupaia chinensis]
MSQLPCPLLTSLSWPSLSLSDRRQAECSSTLARTPALQEGGRLWEGEEPWGFLCESELEGEVQMGAVGGTSPASCPQAVLASQMATWVSWTPPALWTFGCSALLLCLWALCSACSRKQAPRPRRPCAGSQDTVKPVEVSLLRQTALCPLSKSDTRLHELHRGPHSYRALRPASMDLLHPRWLEVSVGGTGLRASSAVPHQELPRPLPAAAAVLPLSPEATYSNVGLAAIPRASLAASPVVWAGAGLTRSCARPGPGASPVVAEYACPEKLKETDWGARKQAEVTAAAQVDVLYSRVCKPKRTGLGHATAQPLPQDRALPLRGLGMDSAPPENVYESIREVLGP